MQTLKQESIVAISELPDTAAIYDILHVLRKLWAKKDAVSDHTTGTRPVSCLDIMKGRIGCVNGPENLSVSKIRMEGYGQ